MNHFIKPFAASCVAILWCCSVYAQPNITRVEYYIDGDPGYGKATALSITPGVNLVNLKINLDTATLATGVHILGVRARDANGAWSLDNRWLFAKPYAGKDDTTHPGPLPNIVRVEYYLDSDPGYGKATALSITAGTNLANLKINLDTALLATGVHILGVRAKDANGTWSHDNRWLFAKPYAGAADTTHPGPLPNITRVEYYIDSDPGYGKGIQLAQENANNIANLSVSINISGLAAGGHTLYIRSKDANNAWSLDNKWDFTIGSATSAASIIANSISKKTMCAGETFSVGYDAKGTYNSGNTFTVQLSNGSGSFTTSINIGSITGKLLNGVIPCSLPTSLATGTGYKVRVVSSSNAVTGSASAAAITINALPAVPTIKPSGDTTFCEGLLVKLTSSAATSYLWSNNATTQSINASKSGNYTVTVSNASGCKATSAPIKITVKANPTPVITSSGATANLCPGTKDTLDAGTGYKSYLWSNNATTQKITVTAAGSYSVKVTNANGCSGTSPATDITYLGCGAPKGLVATVTAATTATLKWKTVTCGVSYQVRYRVTGTSTWTTVSVAVLTAKLKNLSAATTYEWQVATVCQASPLILSTYAKGTNFTTPAAAQSSVAFKQQKTNAGIGANIFPNPAHDYATLQLSGNSSNVTVRVTDMTGKTLWQRRNLNDTKIQVPIANLGNGTYLVVVTSGAENKVLKLVKE